MSIHWCMRASWCIWSSIWFLSSKTSSSCSGWNKSGRAWKQSTLTKIPLYMHVYLDLLFLYFGSNDLFFLCILVQILVWLGWPIDMKREFMVWVGFIASWHEEIFHGSTGVHHLMVIVTHKNYSLQWWPIVVITSVTSVTFWLQVSQVSQTSYNHLVYVVSQTISQRTLEDTLKDWFKKEK